MQAKLVCYSLENANSTVRRNFHREFYGYTDVSCNGKYLYKRKGIIHSVSYRKVLDAIILTTNEKPLVKVLRKYKAKIRIFDVLINFKL
ncbi:MAG: hypothetical protein HZB66_02505 [Candidatus Aenigmarchaeota archaeon]|nr:hypothetical protein [Candidatus Aenigmarchaeota archaeon]